MPPQQQPQNPYGQQSQPSAGGQYPVTPAVPAVGSNGHNPYEFIFDQNAGKKGLHLPGFNGNSRIGRLAVIAGGGVILIVIIAVAASLLSPKSSSAGLTKIAQRQTEIARIADLASEDVTSQEAKNFVANVNASVGSGKQQVVSYLAAHKTTLKPEVLALAKDSKSDATLEAAGAAGAYDTTAAEILTSQLTTYASLLQSTYKTTSNEKTKQLLSDCYVSAINLLKQAEALQGTAQ